MAIDLTELAIILQDTLTRIDNLIIVTGVPAPELGSIDAVAIDLDNNLIFGPKTAAGWGAGRPTVGGQGPAGVISGATISMLAPGAAPTVTLGGTPSDRTVAFAVPAAADGDDGVTPNVSAAVTMIAAGQPALVTRTGPDSAPVFTFQLPRQADGEDGREVEMQAGATHMQWRYVGDATWINLYAKADLQGPQGLKGDAFEFDAKPADLAGRAAYDAEAEGFTVLVMDTGTVYARIGATPGVWSDGFPFGQTQNAILTALSELNATPGLLYQSGADAFVKLAVGAAADDNILDRLSADGRYRLKSANVPMAEVSGLAGALDEKADAAATLVLLGGKQDKSEKAQPNGYAGLDGGGKVPAAQLATATTAQVRAGKASGVLIEPDEAAAAMGFTALTDAATVAVDLDTGPNFTLLTTAGVGAGRTLGLPTNGNPGQYYTFRVTAHAGATLAYHTALKWPGGTVQAIANTAGAITEIAVKMISAARFDVVGFAKDIR